MSDADRTALVEAMADTYAERAKLLSGLLALTPSVSAMEMAVLWAAGASEMRKSQLSPAIKELACVVFDSECQNYIDWIGSSEIRLDLRSMLIKKSITPTLKEMGTSRITAVASLLGSRARNAERLASCIILVLSNDKQNQVALFDRVSTLVNKRSDLNEFEALKIREWITAEIEALKA